VALLLVKMSYFQFVNIIFVLVKLFLYSVKQRDVVIVRDYNHAWGGVPKAVDVFVATIPESLIELTNQRDDYQELISSLIDSSIFVKHQNTNSWLILPLVQNAVLIIHTLQEH